MITFDKLKLVANIDAVREFDDTQFEKIIKNDKIVYKYYIDTPYLLVIKIDYSKHEVVIEFTGRVLGKDYPKLITSDTIRQCFKNINGLGIINLDVEVMMDADVVKCDVTKDIHTEDVPKLTNYVRQHISSYHKYVCRRLRNNNLVVEKNVITKKTKKRMTIYDKGMEMQKNENRQFVEKYGLAGVFDNVCRFEVNLNSKAQIRQSLGTSNTKLQTVLSSDANPITDFLDAMIGSSTLAPASMTDKKSYVTMLVLKDCDYDLEKVEAKMRQFYTSRGTNINTVMQPYRQMMEQINSPTETDYWTGIRSKLLG